jgi:lipopolysaccharide assembly protein A
MRVLIWLLRAFVFFALFAFALNNQAPVRVRWFFGVEWQMPLAMVVLLAFAAGAALGVLAMLPSWWRGRERRRDLGGAQALGPAGPSGAARARATPAARASSAGHDSTLPSGFGPEHPPRPGL